MPKRRAVKTPIFIGLVMLIGLFVSIYFGINRKRESDFKKSYTGILEEALHNVQEANDIYALDRARSRDLFVTSLRLLNDLKAKNVPASELEPLVSVIESGKNRILGEYASSSDIFMDTTLLSQDFKAKKVVLDGQDLYLSDLSEKVFEVDIQTKRSSVVLGSGTISEIVDLAAGNGRSYVMTKSGIYEVKNGKDNKQTDEGDELFRLVAYDTNMYIADIKTGKIWKYVGTDGSFSEPVLWTDSSENADFSGFSDWKIDGNIWVAKSDGKFEKFVQGHVQSFQIKNVIPAIESVTSFYTDKNIKNLYILDSANSRLVVVEKSSGEYIAQYALDGIEKPQSVVISENLKKAIVLADGKLFSIELKHFN